MKRSPGKMANFKVVKNKKAYLRKRRMRRFLTLMTIVIIFAYATHVTYVNRMNKIEDALAELAEYKEQYDAIKLRQEFYLNQVIRLGDEDYIAMLARERHFMSLPNEIIFRFVNDSTNSSATTDMDIEED